MLEKNPRPGLAGPHADLTKKQRRRLMIALVLLSVALALVIVKNREFWFGSDEALESDATDSESVSKAHPATTPAKTGQTPATTATTPKNDLAHKTSSKPVATAAAHDNSTNAEPPAVATNRIVLPPLDVEVVAGDTHHIVHSGSAVAQVEMPADSNRISTVTTSDSNLPSDAATHERLFPAGAPELNQTIGATYPLLGQRMRVQGSVVLQAVIDAAGNIEDLRVLTGPAILTAAAQQAVRQWRFKPYLQNGQPVETKARITVNFSIRISDNPAKTS